MPVISIIVPVYNVEKYINRCVDSILAQTFKDFELILVDDGSLDNCGAICDEYAEQDGRIYVIHKNNGGVSSARNVGIKSARGNYIMFCDSDDYVDTDWLESMFRTIEKFPEALVVCDVEKTNESLAERASPRDTCKVKECSYFELYRLGLSAYSYNKIYIRRIINEIGLTFDESRTVCEDVEFNVKYYAACKKCVVILKKLYFYYQQEDSVMHKYYDNLFEMHLLPFFCRLPLIQEEEMEEYCDVWFYRFYHMFNNVFDPRCDMTFLEKMQYNSRMLKTKEFQYCLDHASCRYENYIIIFAMKKGNYYLVWLIQQISNIKKRIGEMLCRLSP